MVEYTYDSWGKLISITGSLASTIGIENPLRYRGYYYDTETSLYYLQARYYDPDTAYFINADALLIAGNDYIQGMNRYGKKVSDEFDTIRINENNEFWGTTENSEIKITVIE